MATDGYRCTRTRPSRRGGLMGGLTLAAWGAGPAATVSIGRCRQYGPEVEKALARMFDQIGGLGQVVKGKTVALKLNLTGNPGRFPLDPSLPYRTDPTTVFAVVHLMARAGAKRIRMIETFFPARQ